MANFLSLEYLRTGNDRQKAAHDTLTENHMFQQLVAYNPILVGTIPIGIDIENSDLDIICEVEDFQGFSDYCKSIFGQMEGFSLTYKPDRVLVNFVIGLFPVEIYAENEKTSRQMAYRHMLIEHELLQIKGDEFRKEIIALKKQGYKTEPAFAKLLNLSGNPYLEILKFEE